MMHCRRGNVLGQGVAHLLGYKVEHMSKNPIITVTGMGLASGSPDECRIHISLNHLAETAADALAVTAELATKAIGCLADIHAEECDVRTIGLSVQDFFDQAQQKVTAHIGSYHLELTIRPIDAAGVALSSLSSAVGDALQIRGINLTIDDPEPLRGEPRRLAMQDAKTKAAQMAGEMGVELGNIRSISDQQAGNPINSIQTAARAAMPMSGNVPIEAGSVSATSVVTLAYAIRS